MKMKIKSHDKMTRSNPIAQSNLPKYSTNNQGKSVLRIDIDHYLLGWEILVETGELIVTQS